MEGIGLDVGGSPADLPPGYADRVRAAHPRLGTTRALTTSIGNQALADPRKALPGMLAGEIVHQRHPELPYLTWDSILDSSGWRDWEARGTAAANIEKLHAEVLLVE
ncbi:hypothetical protein [Nocardia sp. NBC_00403]|uniref:hypothetical protein n=1 Tax=Nocardia sp. NBC_00403 TaxID=2975990 RepID=UPI002E1D7935